MRTIAVANQKGGTGKTTTVINVAAALVERGRRVVVIDLDPQASLTLSLGLKPVDLPNSVYPTLRATLDGGRGAALQPTELKPGWHLVPTTIDLAGFEVESAGAIGREYALRETIRASALPADFVLVDCPPSLGLLTLNGLTAAAAVLVPVQCQYLAFRGTQMLLQTVEKVRRWTNPDLAIAGILPTFYDRRTAHAREVLDELRAAYPSDVLDPPIPVRVGLADAGVAGQSILEFDPRSDAADAYRRVAEVLDA